MCELLDVVAKQITFRCNEERKSNWWTKHFSFADVHLIDYSEVKVEKHSVEKKWEVTRTEQLTSKYVASLFASERQEETTRGELQSIERLPSSLSMIKCRLTVKNKLTRRREKKKKGKFLSIRSIIEWLICKYMKETTRREWKGLYSIISIALFKPINSWSILRMHQESLFQHDESNRTSNMNKFQERSAWQIQS